MYKEMFQTLKSLFYEIQDNNSYVIINKIMAVFIFIFVVILMTFARIVGFIIEYIKKLHSEILKSLNIK